MRVAVYSGSFNPLHIGHLAIIRHLIEEAGFDSVYLIVSPKNPLKDGISSDSGQERYEAAVAAVKRHFGNPPAVETHVEDVPPPARGCPTIGRAGVFGIVSTAGGFPKVKVDDIELNMPEPHYTILTLDALREREPENSFTLTVGADNLADIRRWRDYRRILKDYGIAVFPRTGFDLEEIKSDLLSEDPSFRITLLEAEMVDISSTIIRNAIDAGQDMSDWLM